MTVLCLLAYHLSAAAPTVPVPAGPAEWFESCARAHAALNAAQIQLEVRQTLNKQLTKTSYELTYIRPDRIRLRAREPEQNGRAASDRTFALYGDDFAAYDATVHERLARQAVPVGSIVERFSALVGKTDDVILGMLEPELLAKFMEPFRTAKGWKVSAVGGVTTLSRRSGTGGAANTTSFQFETATKRLRGMRIGIPDGTLVWQIVYRPAPSSLTWRPPTDAPVVPSFTLRPVAPIYADAQTKRIAERSIAAYDRLRHTTFRIESTMGDGRVWISSGKVREEQPGFTYVWNNGQGAVVMKSSDTFYSGKAGLAGMIEYLARAGVRMDPLVRQIMTRQNPVRVLLVPGVRVSTVGELSISGAPGHMLRFQNDKATVTLVIRKDNGLLSSIETRINDERGVEAIRTTKLLIYDSVGSALDSKLFQLNVPSGFRSAPLASLPK